jgi:uncharacterized protein YcfL
MKKYLFSASILMLFLIVGCTTPTAVMQSWVGKQESDLISSWGAPDSMVELKDGTKVCTWKRVWTDNYGVHQGRQSFTINAEGKVIKWSYENMPAIMLK